MRVDLAAQVLSESVSKALYLTGGNAASETAMFISIMDQFFDCLNVSSLTMGKFKRKPFLNPYRSKDDFCIKFLKEELLPYFQQWKESVERRGGGYSKAAKKRMLLSQETLDGIHITTHSFTELIPHILDVPGVTFFCSAKLNQDPLEKQLQQRGSTNDNPTVAEAVKSTQALRVINGLWMDDITGNCRGQKTKFISPNSTDEPLTKRKRTA